MNLKYLTETVLPKRKAEIKEGKNLGTAQPIYVVLDLQEHGVFGHNLEMQITNLKGKYPVEGYVDMSDECQFRESPKGIKNPTKGTKFWTDKIIAFFLTSEAAHNYLKYQAHNLNNAYVYVFYSGYGNKEMDALLNCE